MLRKVSSTEKRQSLSIREESVGARRHWVRLTSCCNNRCLFCLDSEAQDGRSRPRQEILDDISRGAKEGRRRLVLSGGEPTIHRNFIDFIRAGKEVGFERVQVITNGRMFAHGELLDRSIDAGLAELTISLHGHRAALHDQLVGVPGAFAQTVKTIRVAAQHPGLIVNVDIVVCRPNVRYVTQIIALCRRLGVHEFDLLHIQPFGRAASEERERVIYKGAEHQEALRHIFELGRLPDLFLWTNRFPAPLLEGYEELIQDPHKLADEMRGRFEHVELLLRRNQPLRCRGENCSVCFLEPLCDSLHHTAARLSERGFSELLLDLRSGWLSPLNMESLPQVDRVRILARDIEEVRARLDGLQLPASSVTLILDDIEGLDRIPKSRPPAMFGLSLTRLGGESPSVLNAAISLDVEEIEVSPSLINEQWLEQHRNLEKPRIVVRPPPRHQASECLERDIPPARLAALLDRSSVVAEDLPPCLAGWRPVIWTEPVLAPELLVELTPVSLEMLVNRFAAERYRAHSTRCSDCTEYSTCRGAHIQRIRAFGFGMLKPRG